jgi:hypothetical protein
MEFVSRRQLLRIVRVLHAFVVAVFFSVEAIWAAPPRNLIAFPDAPNIQTLSQNWSDAEANWFYNVPQGSKLIPYVWMLHLEQPESQTRFLDPDHIRSLGYLPRSPEAVGNPDGLPIGFVKDGGDLGLSCAACHTSQVNYRGKSWLVDGAPTLGDAERLQRRLVDALSKTQSDDAKFERFAEAVLGPSASADSKTALRSEIAKVVTMRTGYNTRNLPGSQGAPFGPGRVDAFGAIINEVTETFAQVPGNHAAADAPVSYPFLWDTPQHDKVQWNGAASNTELALLKPFIGTSRVGALGRNAGEVLGVFGSVDATSAGSLRQLKGYPSSINKPNLIAIEESLRNLWSPQWPVEFPAIDPDLKAQGRLLYSQRCESCHETKMRRDDPNRTVTAIMRAVGTDQTMARNFATRSAKTGVLQGRHRTLTDFRTFGPEAPVQDILVHMVQRVVVFPSPGNLPEPFAAEQLLASLSPAMEYSIQADIHLPDGKLLSGAFSHIEMANGKVSTAVSRDALRLKSGEKLFRQHIFESGDLNHFTAPDGSELHVDNSVSFSPATLNAGGEARFSTPATIEFAYKARPLNGIWATAPYLHNGSVASLDELLKPPAKRMAKFRVGSREFDPAKVGFVTDSGSFEFDTSLPGNSNTGHDYGPELTDVERAQLLEYLKSL